MLHGEVVIQNYWGFLAVKEKGHKVDSTCIDFLGLKSPFDLLRILSISGKTSKPVAVSECTLINVIRIDILIENHRIVKDF